MIKYLGLDVGSKTIGLAKSEGQIAQPLETIRFEEWNFEEAVSQLTQIIKEETPELIIIGYPKNMDGSIGERAEMVDYFIEGLIIYNPKYKNKIIKVDERRTTKMAKAIMIEAGVNRKKQKESKDGLAAQLILELFLESNKN